MRSKRIRILFAGVLAAVATGAIVVATSASPPPSDNGASVASVNSHLAPLDEVPKRPEFNHDPIAHGSTASGSSYGIALAEDESDRYLCYEISLGEAAASACSDRSEVRHTLSIPAAFGEDVIVVSVVGPDVDEIRVGRADGEGGDVVGQVANSGDYRLAHVSFNIPQSSWVVPAGAEAPSGTTSAAPIPPALKVTTLDRSGKVLDQEVINERPAN